MSDPAKFDCKEFGEVRTIVEVEALSGKKKEGQLAASFERIIKILLPIFDDMCFLL